MDRPCYRVISAPRKRVTAVTWAINDAPRSCASDGTCAPGRKAALGQSLGKAIGDLDCLRRDKLAGVDNGDSALVLGQRSCIRIKLGAPWFHDTLPKARSHRGGSARQETFGHIIALLSSSPDKMQDLGSGWMSDVSAHRCLRSRSRYSVVGTATPRWRVGTTWLAFLVAVR
jgi:hypothetical protein